MFCFGYSKALALQETLKMLAISAETGSVDLDTLQSLLNTTLGAWNRVCSKELLFIYFEN
jgi:hypothetical protein